MSKHITDAEVEIEIRKIYDSEAYRLGSAEIRYRRDQIPPQAPRAALHAPRLLQARP